MQKNLSTTVDHQSLSAHACVQNAATGDLLTVTKRLKPTPVNITFDMVVSHFLLDLTAFSFRSQMLVI